jgi:hypothetical protein
MTVAILVLQPFAVEGSTSRGSAYKETPGLGITSGPAKIADSLKPKHGVINIERY